MVLYPVPSPTTLSALRSKLFVPRLHPTAYSQQPALIPPASLLIECFLTNTVNAAHGSRKPCEINFQRNG
jgi:hypothetical protein